MGARKARDLKPRISLKASTEALSPLIGSLFILLVVIVFAGAVAAGAFGICGSSVAGNLEPVGACIEIELVEGGLYNSGSENIKLEKNRIILVHVGGSPLALESTSVLISGHGNSHHGPFIGGSRVEGDTLVTYADLTTSGKNKKYGDHNQQMLEDGVWTAGERLVLNGKNSPTGDDYTSVHVKVNETEDTKDNYGFKAGSEITITLVDTERRVRLAQEEAIVDIAP